MQTSTNNIIALYERYGDELQRLCRCLREQYHRVQRFGYNATFGDIESEIVYLLIRETKPEVVFEISSAAGWSTNYLLAAVTANSTGMVHAFELSPTIKGNPTEVVIRGNQHPEWDQGRLVVHIGDARELVSNVEGNINFLLLDSCHEDYFARWYLMTLLPRVHGTILIQDIAFRNHLEPSSEAREVWRWAKQEGVALHLVGGIEFDLAKLGVRRGLAERRMLRSNSVFFSWPLPKRGSLPEIAIDPGERHREIGVAIEHGNFEYADTLLNTFVSDLVWSPNVANRHRDFMLAGTTYRKLGSRLEAIRCAQRALGAVLASDSQQRAKGLVELIRMYVKCREWKLAGAALMLALLESRARKQLLRAGLGTMTGFAIRGR